MFGTWATDLYVKAVELARSSVNHDEEGQGMIEYGLLVALISIAAIAVIIFIGPALKSNFQDVVNSL